MTNKELGRLCRDFLLLEFEKEGKDYEVLVKSGKIKEKENSENRIFYYDSINRSHFKNQRVKVLVLVALFVVGIIMFAGCVYAIYQYYSENFYVQKNDDLEFEIIGTNDGVPIEHYLKMNFIPEGFYCSYENSNSFVASYRYTDGETDESIDFYQISGYIKTKMDDEDDETKVIRILDREYFVYCSQTEKVNIYIWSEGTCVCKLKVSGELPFEEVKKIIINIQ